MFVLDHLLIDLNPLRRRLHPLLNPIHCLFHNIFLVGFVVYLSEEHAPIFLLYIG